MKISLSAVAAVAAVLFSSGFVSARGFERGAAGSAVFQRRRRVVVPKPNRIADPGGIVRDNRTIPYPSRDGRGAAISKPAAVVPPAGHAAVVGNAAFARSVASQQRVEVVPNRYYWHSSAGVRYCHYYSGGVHWYGFYHGPSFYWTRYYGSRWWWFDARFGGRWVYWWDGFWWWPGPVGVLYVYVDNAYYPYDAEGVTVVNQEMQQAPEAPPSPGAGSSSASPDGRRLVQIVGGDGEAYLYDKTGPQPSYLKFLGRGAQKARFSGGTGGAPLQILLEFKDGSFALYDADGGPVNAVDAAAPSAAPPPPAPAPGQSPPPPPGGASP